MTELIHTGTDLKQVGWQKVAENMGCWNPSLQEHTRHDLATRGLTDATEKNPNVTIEEYLAAAKANLLTTSRTASGLVDSSASDTKALSLETISGDEAASKAQYNYEKAITRAYEARKASFDNVDQLRGFVESLALQINDGIVKEGALIRSGEDPVKYPYTRVAELEGAMEGFYNELFAKLRDPNQDPVELAAWVEYRVDLTDHFFSDGCGKTAKALSSYVLMRKGQPLPTFTTRDAYYEHAPRQIVGTNPEADKEQYDKWLAYYRTLF